MENKDNIYRLMYMDESDHIHSRRFIDKNKANEAFQIINKKGLPIRCDTLNKYGEVTGTKDFGPMAFWDQTLSERVAFKKLYFNYADDGNIEETYLMTNEEAEEFLREYANEPGFGTEWIWCPVVPEY